MNNVCLLCSWSFQAYLTMVQSVGALEITWVWDEGQGWLLGRAAAVWCPCLTLWWEGETVVRWEARGSEAAWKELLRAAFTTETNGGWCMEGHSSADSTNHTPNLPRLQSIFILLFLLTWFEYKCTQKKKRKSFEDISTKSCTNRAIRQQARRANQE